MHHERQARVKVHTDILTCSLPPCSQELKGNIRVFCRVRPAPDTADASPLAVGFPAGGDLAGRGIELTAASAPGRPAEAQSFAFDRVFGPTATQASADDL